MTGGASRPQRPPRGRPNSGRPPGSRAQAGRGGAATPGKKSAPRAKAARRPNLSAPEAQEVHDVHDAGGIRLQKVLAQAGIGSRRACEILIATGRVQVDGQTVREQGTRIDPARHVVYLDGVRIKISDHEVYLAFNKPLGVVSTMSDEKGRRSLGDYFAERPERLFHVGRLDADTEGLILLTNDGDLAHRLAHPAHEVPKTYLAEVRGPVAKDVGRTLRAGITLTDGPAKVDSFRLIDSQPGRALVELVLHEGRNRIVRRILDEVGHPVERLVRLQVGPIHLGDLKPGRWRVLSRAEVGQLFALAEPEPNSR